MKRIIIIALVIVLSVTNVFAAQKIEAKFSKGVELMGVVFRLAGAKEYSFDQIPGYNETVDTYFEAMKNHPAVLFAKESRRKGISYDAVAAYGLHLEFTDSGIALESNSVKGSDDSFDRWSESGKEEFLPFLNDFYKKSDFESWYDSKKALREEAERAFDREIISNIDFDWFDSYFYGEQRTQKTMYVSFMLCHANYGLSMTLNDGTELLCPVYGSCSMTDEGTLTYAEIDLLGIIVHEFCHNYCNPLVDKYWSLQKKGNEKAFAIYSQRLSNQAYTSAITAQYETFVRSSVIRYLLSHDKNADINHLIAREEALGFLLTRGEVEALDVYENNRSEYKDMDSFMNVLSKFNNSFSYSSYKKHHEEFTKDLASYTCNVKSGQKNIPAGEFDFVITFSKPMKGDITIDMADSCNDIPEITGAEWNKEKTILTINCILEPKAKYGLRIRGEEFTTADGFYADGTKSVDFSTK